MRVRRYMALGAAVAVCVWAPEQTSAHQAAADGQGWLLPAFLVAGAVVTCIVGVLLFKAVKRLRLTDSILKSESSKRAEVEQALQTSKELLSRIVQVHSEGMLVLDAEGTILFANPAAVQMTGREDGGLDGFPFGSLAGRDRTEVDLLTRDGSRRVVEIRSETLVWRGQPATLLCLRDVTASRRAEERLKQSRAMLQSTFESMQDLLVVLDRDHNILLSNWRGIEDKKELLNPENPTCFEALSGQGGTCEECPVGEVYTSGKSAEFERVDPETGRIYQVRVTPILDEEDNVERVVEHLRDITRERRATESLRESERNYKLLARNIPNAAVHMFNHKLEYVVSDGAILETLGLNAESMNGKTIYDFLPRELAQQMEPHYRAALLGERRTTELVFQGRFFEVRTLPMEDGDKGIIAGMVLSMDITDRKLAEGKLRASEKRYRAVFDNAAVGVCTLNLEGRFMETNHVYATMLGYTPEELTGMTILDVTAEEDRERYRSAFEQFLAGRGPNLFIEKDNVSKNRTHIPVRAGVSLVDGHDGEEGYLVAMVEDITLRRRSEKALAEHGRMLEAKVQERTARLEGALEQTRDAKNKIEAIITSISEGLMVTDRNNAILLLNEQAEEILGIRLAENFGKNVSLAIKACTYREKLCRHIQRAQESTSYSFDIEVTDDQGRERIYQARTSVIVNDEGEQDGVVIIMSDVTREREIDRMKSQFISTAAHELRTPMTSILGYTELLATRNNLTIDAVARYAGTANRMAGQLASIVNDLLDISRIESGKGFSFNMERTSMRDLIRNKVEIYSHMTDKHVLLTDFAPDVDEAWVDAGRTEQVLENCISNAVKYSPDGGMIAISLQQRDDEFLQVTVQDQGLGMNPEQLSRVFEHFYRAHDQNGKIQGTGLGMSIVKYIVEQQGGEVWLESEEGVGTSLHFTLPGHSLAPDASIDITASPRPDKGAHNAKEHPDR